MYAEWKEENTDVRKLLLYFQELYVELTGKELYFSKGNVTTARKVIEFCKEIEITPMKYIKLFMNFNRYNVAKTGFRYMSSDITKKKVISLILNPRLEGAGSEPEAIYDRIKDDIGKSRMNIDTVNVVTVIDSLISENITKDTFIYLIACGGLIGQEYEDLITQTKSLKDFLPRDHIKRILLYIKRGILPQDYEQFKKYKTFKDWSQNNDKPSDSNTKKMVADGK